MRDGELLAELATHSALIVHCSRPGKADEGLKGLFFPRDLQKASHICAVENKELCCSVIWPRHVKTFGSVGIVLKPRSVSSITSICTIDGGTYLDPITGKRVGAGLPFSKQGVLDTFSKATDYNEWNVQAAETIGIFVHPADPLEVAKKFSLKEIPGYDPSMGDGEEVGTVVIDHREVAAQFPTLPIYTLSNLGIARLEGSERVSVSALELYGLCNGINKAII